MAKYDIIIIGSGFSSCFFLNKWLHKRPHSKVLVLERGAYNSLDWQIRNRRNHAPEFDEDHVVIKRGIQSQNWPHTIGVGGGSNCWGANAMRMHPSGFELKTLHGIGVDWPIKYRDLEEYYAEAELIMDLSGDDESAIHFPRSRPFPQPPHRFNDISLAFKKAYPEHFFAMPQARARVSTARRNMCCANLACRQCPSNAKFTILNDMIEVFEDTNVNFLKDSKVLQIVTQGNSVTGVLFLQDGITKTADAEIIVLAANAIYNPQILTNSNITQGPVGQGLTEQSGVNVTVYIGDNIDSANGSSPFGGVGYNFLFGDHLSRCAGGFYEIGNGILFRPDPNKWRSIITITALFDDLRGSQNSVSVSKDIFARPVVEFHGWSQYSEMGRLNFINNLNKLLSPFDVEEIFFDLPKAGGYGHIQGTTVMGNSPSSSVVDGKSIHHFYRNLIVLGSGNFPTAGGVNPTLTLSAMALRTADLF